jgi:hypothetical protein
VARYIAGRPAEAVLVDRDDGGVGEDREGVSAGVDQGV